MREAGIYTVNSGAQAVALGGTINLGTINRRFGERCCRPSLDLNGSSITLNEPGYYDVDVTITALPTAAGPVTITVNQDGIAVPGSTNSAQATAGNPVNVVSLPTVRVRRGSASNISVVLANGAGTVANISVKIIKAFDDCDA